MPVPTCYVVIALQPDSFTGLLQVLSGSAALLIAIVSVIVAILTYLRRGKVRVGKVWLDFSSSEARALRQSDSYIEPTGSPGGPGDKQFVLLSEYHAQGLAQSRISFWFSLVFAGMGFAVIATALLTMKPEVSLTQQARPFISIVSGVITEAVSALFFVQSNKARSLMIEFFDKLRADRKLEEALRLASDLPDAMLQSRLRVLLALNFVDRKSTDEFLSSILGVTGPTAPPKVTSA